MGPLGSLQCLQEVPYEELTSQLPATVHSAPITTLVLIK